MSWLWLSRKVYLRLTSDHLAQSLTTLQLPLRTKMNSCLTKFSTTINIHSLWNGKYNKQFVEHPDEKEALSGVFFLKHRYTITNQIFQNKVIFFECLITLRFLRTGHVAPFAARPTSQVFPFQEQHIVSYSGMILMLLFFFLSLKLTELEKAPFLSTLPQTCPPLYHPIVFVLLSNSKNYFLNF